MYVFIYCMYVCLDTMAEIQRLRIEDDAGRE
jgi:hypothetical protein